MREFLFATLLLAVPASGFSQDIESTARTTPPAKEAFSENAPLKEVAFDQRRYNAKQQRLREHYLEVPLGPMPEARRTAADPMPPKQTRLPHSSSEVGLGLSIVQNRALLDSETNNATSTVCEPSLAVRGQEVLFTGNWFASFSRDGGNSFQYRNPETTFPSIPRRNFCCDQAAIYVPSHDLMVWFLQYAKDSTGNTIRIAVAHGADIAAERWRYYDFTPQAVGNWEQEWFDYPDLAFSRGSLFLTTNCFSMSDQFRRSVTLRLSLDELKSYAGLNYRYFDRTNVGSLRLTQGGGGTMYIGTHRDLGTLRVFAWRDGSTAIQSKDFTVQPWHRGGASSPGPDGNDWLGFVDGRITAAWSTDTAQGFAWTSAKGGSFPQPHIRAAVVDWAAGTVSSQPHVWNDSIAFAYPAAAANAGSRVGMTLAYGGGPLFPSHAVGVFNADQSWTLVATELGKNGPATNRWGDYFTIRTHGQAASRFVSAGFTLAGGSDRQDIVPRLIQFDVVDSGGSPGGNSVGSGNVGVVRQEMPRQEVAAHELLQLNKVLASEKRVRFSKATQNANLEREARNPMVRVLSANSRKATVSIGAAGELESYARLLKLPPAYSFFYDSPESVCLPDDRLQVLSTEDAPWSNNCQLVITFSDGSQAVGTGWLLGPRLVVTAGHCVHEGEGGAYFKSVEVIPGMNGPSRPYGSMHSTKFRASASWKTNGEQAADYGAILLPQEFKLPGGKSPSILPLVVLGDTELSGYSLAISGYPADKPFGTQWRDSGPLLSALPKRLAYTIDTYGGHSGSAVVATVNGQLHAIGIHNYGGCPNRCTRITDAVKADLQQWLAESNAP